MTTIAHSGLGAAREVLDNGAVVITKHNPTTPAVTLHASIRAGTIYDPPGAAGVAHFVSRVLDRGTASRTADDIAEDLDGRGVALSITVNRHALVLTCTCLVEDVSTVLTLIADMIMRPSFPSDEVETRRSEIVTLIRQDEDNPAVVANETLLSELYGSDHPYGWRPRGSVETVEAIDRAALERFHRDWFRPSALSLALVGDIDRARAIDAVRTAISGWNAPPPAAFTLPEAAPPPGRRIRVVPMMNKAQADIAYGFTSVRRSDPAYYAYWLMNNILGQYSMGGRLGDSIRERQGMAYYAFSALDANVIAGPLTIRAGVSPANVERAVASIDAELTRMASEGPHESEVAESRQYLIGSMPRTLETNVGIANFLQTAEFFGLGADYDLRMPGLLQAVTRDEIHEAARQLDPARATAVVAGPYEGTLR